MVVNLRFLGFSLQLSRGHTLHPSKKLRHGSKVKALQIKLELFKQRINAQARNEQLNTIGRVITLSSSSKARPSRGREMNSLLLHALYPSEVCSHSKLQCSSGVPHIVYKLVISLL